MAPHKTRSSFRSALVAAWAAIVVLAAAACGPTATPVPVGPTLVPATRAPISEPSVPDARPAQHLRFEHLSLEDGLSQSSVNCILQDDQGFMWFGTEDGLNRYDGYDFTVYRHISGDPSSLRQNAILSLYEDHTGALWVGMDGGGLDRFDRDTGQFVHYTLGTLPNSVNSQFVRVIYEDRAGTLWAGTDGNGLARLDRATESFVHYVNDPQDSSSLGHNAIRAIYEDSQGQFWVGTDGGGLERFDRSTGHFTHYRHDPSDPYSLSSDAVRVIYEDREGTLWIGTEGGGLNRLDRATGHFRHYLHRSGEIGSLSHDSVRAIYEDTQGILWIGTAGGGLDQMDRTNVQFSSYQNDSQDSNSLSSNTVISIYEDRGGVLWIGTKGGGVNKVFRSAAVFEQYRAFPGTNGLSNNMVLALYEDRQGILWVGTDGGGLDRLDRAQGQFTHYRHDLYDPYSLGYDVVRSIYEDSTGSLWIGLDNGTVDLLDRSAGQFTHYQATPSDPVRTTDDPVLAILEDRQGYVWIGTAGGGLNYLDRAVGRFLPYQNLLNFCCLSSDYVRAIYEDRAGALWVGTGGGGLNRLDREKQQITVYTADSRDPLSLSNNTILSIYEARAGTLWIGTSGGGLDRFDSETGTFTHYTERNGLPNDTVYGILEDDRENLWLSTNHGLSRFDPAKGTFENYDVADGLQSNEFNSGAYFKSRTGEMLFGGINGFNVFYPNRIEQYNAYIPPVVLTSLTQSGDPIATDQALADTQKITLHWPQNYFEFEFAALSYVQPEKNQYAYRLETFDRDWNYVGTRRFGRYTNLPGGTYTLQLKASNNDGIWNEKGTSLVVVVVPPLWESWWFRGFVALALLGGAFAIYWLRVRSIAGRSRELESLVARRTAELWQEIEQRMEVEEALRNSELEQAIAAERSRLARDLHDAVTQTLFSASLIAEALPASLKRDPEGGKDLLRELQQLTRGALAEMRTLLMELRPAALLEADLNDLLHQLAAAISSREGIPITVTVHGGCPLPEDVQIAFYRIAQEALNNVIKHANASQVEVCLDRVPPPPSAAALAAQCTRAELSVRDDGRGFNPGCVPAEHLGLGIMRERAQAIGGCLTIESQLGQGTQITVVWEE
jgi:signal transduction histidine kinase/ligand-binding sensor domain-containing protein